MANNWIHWSTISRQHQTKWRQLSPCAAHNHIKLWYRTSSKRFRYSGSDYSRFTDEFNTFYRFQSVAFYDFIANETYAFVQLLNEAIFLTLSASLLQMQPSVTLHPQQFHVLSRCTDLPDQLEFRFRQAPQIYRKGLANFQGVLTAHTDTQKFM